MWGWSDFDMRIVAGIFYAGLVTIALATLAAAGAVGYVVFRGLGAITGAW